MWPYRSEGTVPPTFVTSLKGPKKVFQNWPRKKQTHFFAHINEIFQIETEWEGGIFENKIDPFLSKHTHTPHTNSYWLKIAYFTYTNWGLLLSLVVFCDYWESFQTFVFVRLLWGGEVRRRRLKKKTNSGHWTSSTLNRCNPTPFSFLVSISDPWYVSLIYSQFWVTTTWLRSEEKRSVLFFFRVAILSKSIRFSIE